MRPAPALIVGVAAAAAAIVGCGGGGGVPGGTTSGPVPGLGQATFTLTIPNAAGAAAAGRRPAYISPNAQSIAIAIAAGGTPAAPVVANLTAGAPNCTVAAGATTCSTAYTAPAGNDTFAIALYAGPNATGAVLSTTSLLLTIVPGTNSPFALTLNGVAASIAVNVTKGSNLIPGGYPTTLPVVVTAKDASGATIVGPGNYANPIALTNADASGVTTLSTTTVTSPSTTVTLTYAPSDANRGVLALPGLPVGATTIGASATGVPPANVTPGTFQYIADRFAGFGNTRTLTGTATVTTTTYNGAGVPSPNPSAWSYTVTDNATTHGNVTFGGVSGLVQTDHAFTFAQTSPAPAPPVETETVDHYRSATLTATGAIFYLLFDNAVDVNAGPITSPISRFLVGTTTSTYAYPLVGGWQEDVLPHATATWTDNQLAFTQVYTGAQVGTAQWNTDGSFSYTQTAPTIEQELQNADGSATVFNNGGNGVTTTLGTPRPAPTGTNLVIPGAAATTSPAPAPTSTFFAADWYPNGGAVAQPALNNGYTLALVTIPAGCNVPATIATQAYANAHTQNWLRTVSFQLRTHVQTDYYVPGGIGWVCETIADTITSYRYGTGVISAQTVTNEVFGLQSAAALSVRRR